MSIISFISKVCVQDAVYWAPGTDNGFGEKTWTVTQIKVRWEGGSDTIINKYGKEVVSSAKVMVQQELNVDGFLYLGTLSSLTTSQKENPLLVDTAYPIQKLEITPLFKSATKFVYQIYL